MGGGLVEGMMVSFAFPCNDFVLFLSFSFSLFFSICILSLQQALTTAPFFFF